MRPLPCMLSNFAPLSTSLPALDSRLAVSYRKCRAVQDASRLETFIENSFRVRLKPTAGVVVQPAEETRPIQTLPPSLPARHARKLAYRTPASTGVEGLWSSLARHLHGTRATLTAIVLLALLIRLTVVAFAFKGVAAPTADHNDFGWEMGWIARSLALGQGFTSPFLPLTGPTALVPPVYPYLVAACFRLFGLYTPAAAIAVLSFNSLCSALTCVPLFLLLRNSLNDRVARLAALAWAIYPFAIYFSAARVWDYALTALLFTTCLLVAQRLHLRPTIAWVGFGALYGVAVLSNPSILTMLPVLLLLALYKVWRVGGTWKTKALAATLAFFAVCTPWNVRNHQVLHANFFLRDGFWIEFYAGNNGDTYESNSAWAHPASSDTEMRRFQALGEIDYIAEKHALAQHFVLQHPGFFAIATARRVVRFWTGFWSFGARYLRFEPLDLPNVPFCLFLLWAMARGIRRFWRDAPGAAVPYFLALLIFPLPYYLTHSSMDYRQPLEPIIVVLVTIGLFGTRDRPREIGQGATFEFETAAA